MPHNNNKDSAFVALGLLAGFAITFAANKLLRSRSTRRTVAVPTIRPAIHHYVKAAEKVLVMMHPGEA